MSHSRENITIHTRKFYRVTLLDLDDSRETPDSFALKLSLATRTPVSHARQIVSALPHPLKSNLTAGQANRLKSIVEDIGGSVIIEPHYVTPGESPSDTRQDFRARGSKMGAPAVCPSCGSEIRAGAEYCELCLRRFRSAGDRRPTLRERLPEVNPLSVDDDTKTGWLTTVAPLLLRHRLAVLIGAVALLLLIVILK